MVSKCDSCLLFHGQASLVMWISYDAGNCYLADQFFDFLSTVNKELDYLQMEVRGGRNQYTNTGTMYYGIVNKLANEEAKLGTRLTLAQLTFFKAIVSGDLLCCFHFIKLQFFTKTFC